jgi:hypothetical protein
LASVGKAGKVANWPLKSLVFPYFLAISTLPNAFGDLAKWQTALCRKWATPFPKGNVRCGRAIKVTVSIKFVPEWDEVW